MLNDDWLARLNEAFADAEALLDPAGAWEIEKQIESETARRRTYVGICAACGGSIKGETCRDCDVVGSHWHLGAVSGDNASQSVHDFADGAYSNFR